MKKVAKNITFIFSEMWRNWEVTEKKWNSMANYLTSEAARNENESKVKQAGMVDFFENGLQNQLSKAEVYEHYFSACK